jgi:uncharacterized protein (DUF697 family)
MVPFVASLSMMMASNSGKSFLRRRVEQALQQGFDHAYQTVRVDSGRYLLQLQLAYGMPVSSYRGLFSLPIEHLDAVASEIIRSGMKMAAAEGAGLGIGGIMTLLPDLGILAAITLRTIQKLSLVYGFEFNTDGEMADLWIAAASAAGVDISRELLEKQVVNRFVPRVVQRIAVQASGEVVERWAGRMIPLLSSVIGGTLNWYFVGAWGERARNHFREKHMQTRAQINL